MMHCRQCRSLSCESAGARALRSVGARAHARSAPRLWRRRRPWCCDCVCVVVRRKRWDGWGVCDGGCVPYGIDRVGESFVVLVVRRWWCWPAVLRA